MKSFRLPIPIRILVAYLTLLAFFAVWSWSGADVSEWLRAVRNLALLLLSATLVYQAFVRFGSARPTRSEHRVITALILFLLFDPMLPWWIFALLGFAVEIVQRLLRTQLGPILNPAAAAGLLISFLGYFPGWWGMSFSPRLLLIAGGVSSAVLLLPIAAYVAYSYKKLYATAGFLFGVLVFLPLLLQRSPVFMLLEGTLLFFGLVMIPEPKTSPVLPLEQMVFGASIGLLYCVLLRIHFVEPSLGALLIANAVWYGWKTWKQRRKVVTTSDL